MVISDDQLSLANKAVVDNLKSEINKLSLANKSEINKLSLENKAVVDNLKSEISKLQAERKIKYSASTVENLIKISRNNMIGKITQVLGQFTPPQSKIPQDAIDFNIKGDVIDFLDAIGNKIISLRGMKNTAGVFEYIVI